MGYQRRVHGGTTQANMRPIPVLLIVLAGSYSCAALSSETDVVVPETFGHREAFANLPAADFIQTVSSSGGSEADCERFADDTIADIKATVIEQQRIVDEVPNGDLCAAEGQKEVIMAKNATETAKTEAEAAEKALNTTETDKARICTAGVDLPTVYLNLLQNSCFNYEDTLAYKVAKGKCKDATEAVKKAKEAAKQAKEDVDAKEDEQEEHEKEAQRLKSGCLCDTHQRQTQIQAAQEKATSTHESEWTRAHEVLCALKQTPECDISPCPTVERRTLADGVAEAKEALCKEAQADAPTKSPTQSPTIDVIKFGDTITLQGATTSEYLALDSTRAVGGMQNPPSSRNPSEWTIQGLEGENVLKGTHGHSYLGQQSSGWFYLKHRVTGWYLACTQVDPSKGPYNDGHYDTKVTMVHPDDDRFNNFKQIQKQDNADRLMTKDNYMTAQQMKETVRWRFTQSNGLSTESKLFPDSNNGFEVNQLVRMQMQLQNSLGPHVRDGRYLEFEGAARTTSGPSPAGQRGTWFKGGEFTVKVQP